MEITLELLFRQKSQLFMNILEEYGEILLVV